MYLNKTAEKIITIFFLILFTNSIYAQTFNLPVSNSEPIFFSDAQTKVTEKKIIADSGAGCMTVELPEESVEKLWRSILLKGFSAEVVTSNQTPIKSESVLERNEVLLTEPDAKAGDLAIKKEIPSQIIDPSEIPTILGKVCIGPHYYGVNLDSTYRVGRCDTSQNAACYLTDLGLYRNNSASGFWRQTSIVKKDALNFLGLSKLKEETGEAILDKDYSTDVDLGVFSDMSLEEINYYNKIANNPENDLNGINIEKLNMHTDKAIKNNTLTDSFAAQMQTTCRGEDCYINTYSLFDKMFNQYFTVDMVFSSASPLILNTAARIFKNKTAVKAFNYIPDKLENAGIIKKNGFIHDLLDDPVNLIRHPVQQTKIALSSQRYRHNVDAFLDNINSGVIGRNTPEIRLRDLQQYKIDGEMKEFLGGITDKKKTSEFLHNAIVNNDSFNKAQKYAFTDVATEYFEEFKIANSILEARVNDDVYKSAMKKIQEFKLEGTPPGLWTTGEKGLTFAEYDAVVSTASDAVKLGKGFKNNTFQGFSWDEGLDSLSIVNNREMIDPNTKKIVNLNKVISKNSGDATSIGNKALRGAGDPFEITIKVDDKTGKMIYGTKAGSSSFVDPIDVTFKDGSTAVVERIKVQNVIPNDSTRQVLRNTTAVEAFANSTPDGFIRYIDPSTNEVVEVSAHLFNKTQVDALGISQFEVFDSIKSNLGSEVYGLDPIETAYAINDGFLTKKFKDASVNSEEMVKTLSNKEWVTGKGISGINKKMKEFSGASYQRFFTRNHLTFAFNLGYWELKSGFNTFFGDRLGLTKYSILQLPETYTSLQIKHQNTPLYSDSYVDFFANEGSDQGDLFMKYLNSALFWSSYATKELTGSMDNQIGQSINKFVTNLTEGKIRRSEVDNIVIITDNMSTGCGTGCTYKFGDNDLLTDDIKNEINFSVENEKPDLSNSQESLESQETTDSSTTTDLENSAPKTNENSVDLFTGDSSSFSGMLEGIRITYATPQNIKTQNYIIENTLKDNLEKKGQTLISFSHHTDYDGVLANTQTENSINLEMAKKNEETCADKLKSLELLGMPIGLVMPDDYRSAGALVLAEHIAYLAVSSYTSAWLAPALLSNIPQALFIMPEINQCVDDKEGYYTHIFVSKAADDRVKSDSKNKIAESISKSTDKLEEGLVNLTAGTELEQTVSAGAQEIKNFADQKLVEYPIAQAQIVTGGNTYSTVNGDLFFVELGAGTKCRASNYSDKGVEVLKDETNNINLEINKEDGTLKVTDETGVEETIIDSKNKDFVRLIADNLSIPAKIIPHRLSYIPVSDSNSDLFEIDGYGNFIVKDASFLNCLKNGYFNQTGIEIPGSVTNLIDYLGPVKMVNNAHPSTAYDIVPNNGKLVAEGTPRKVAEGSGAKAIVSNGNRSTKLIASDNKDFVGYNVAVQFERGQLIYNSENKSYVMWVEYTSITNEKDISGLRATLNTENKAQNGCDETEIAIDFKAQPDADNDRAKDNVDNLNKALEHVGPFQMFDTPTKTFIFYVSDPPECEQRMKVIDKQTGEIYDQKITDITQTPEGIIVKTDDGQEHKLEFSADNGVPRLTYNGDTETLTSAQGKNGSFWYDPQTGNWYTENGHMIPLNDTFKDGMYFAKDPNTGQVSSTGPGNIFNIGSGGTSGGSGGFNIPLAPENFVLFSFYVSIILLGFLFVYLRSNKKDL